MSSNNMDERIVKLQLNNKDFEKNARISMHTLNDLNSSMDMTGTTKNLNKSLSSVNDNTALIATTMEKVSKSWSAWEIVAITAISNITNRVIDLGERLIKSLSVDQISSGWSKFGELTKNTATLAAQNLKDANGAAADIDGNLKKLLWFSDATSYSFTDMTNNISKFTAAGQTLDDSTTAMMGIANWAAMAGQNAQTASRAMYQISQAMSTGTMRYQDWKSIQNANMDTVQFREQAVQAAIEAGQLYKEADDLYRTLEGKEYSLSQLFSSDGLGDLWFTADVMMDTFSRFSSAVEAAYASGKDPYEAIAQYQQTVSEMTDTDQKELAEFGLAAFKAAQECRTLEDAINAIKDAVSSGFMESFELMFGSLEEAKKLWNDVYDSLDRIFIGNSKTLRNNALKLWKDLGGRNDLFANTEKQVGALFQLLNAATEIVNSFKESFLEVFFDIDSTLSDNDKADLLSKKFKMLTESIKKMSEAINKGVIKHRSTIKNIIKIVFNGVKLIVNVLRLGVKTIKSVINGVKPLLKLFSGGPAGLLGLSEKLNKKIENLIKTSGVFEKVEKGLTKFTTELVETIKKLNLIDKVKSGFNKFKEALSNNGKTVESLKKIWDSLKIIMSKTSKVIINIIPKIMGLLGKALTKVVYYLAKGLAKLVSAGEKLAAHLKKWRSKPKTIERWGKLTDFLSRQLDNLGNAIKRLYRNAKELLSTVKFSKISDGIKEIGKSVKNLGKTFTNFSKKQFGKVKTSTGEKSSNFIDALVSAFKENKGKKNLKTLSDLASKSERDELLAEKRYYKNLQQNQKLAKETVKETSKLQKFFNGLASALEPVINLLKSVFGLAKALFGLLSGFLNSLSRIIDKITEFINKHSFFKKSMLVKVGVLAGIALFVKIIYDIVMTLKIIEAFADTVYAFNTYIRAKAFFIVAATIRSIAVSLLMMSANMYILSKIPTSEFKKGIGRLSALIGIMTGFLAIVVVLARLFGPKGEISRSTYGIFGKNADKVLERSMKTTAFSQLGSSVMMLTHSLTNLAIALSILLIPLSKISKIPTKVYKTAMKRLIQVMGLVTGVLIILSASAAVFGRIKDPKGTIKLLTKSTKNLMAISVSLIVVQYAMQKIAKMKTVDYKSGIKRIGAIFAAITAYMVLMATVFKERKWEKLIGDTIKSGSSALTATQAMNQLSGNLLSLSASMGILIYASTRIAKLKWVDVKKSALVLSSLFASLGVLSTILLIFNKGKEIKEITNLTKVITKGNKASVFGPLKDLGLILIGLSTLLTSIAVSLLLFRELDASDIRRGSKIIVSFLAGIMVVIFALSLFLRDKQSIDNVGEALNGFGTTASDLSKGMKSLAVLVYAFLGFMGAFMIASIMPTGKIVRGIAVFGIVIASIISLILSMKLLGWALKGSSIKEQIIMLSEILISLYAMIGAFALINKINVKPSKLAKFLGSFAVAMVVLAGVFKIITLLAKTIKVTTIAYISTMFASFYAMIGLIQLLNMVTIDHKTWAKGGKALGMFAIAIATFIAVCAGLGALSAVFPIMAAGVAILQSLTITMLAFVAALFILQKIDMTIIAQKLQELVPIITTFISDSLTALQQNIETWAGQIIDIILSIINALTAKIPVILEAIRKFFWALLKETGKQILNATKEEFKLYGELLIDYLLLPFRSVKATFERIKKFFVDLWHNLKAAVTGELSWKDFGKRLVEGLWEGIKGKYEWLWGQIKNFGNKIKNGIKKIFGIASPSKFMIGIGKYLDMGLAKGIEQDISVIDKPINTIANMIADGVDDQLTITPVMDLTEIQNGTNKMNSMLSSSNGYSINPSMASNTYRSVDNRNASIRSAASQPVTSAGDNYVLNNTFNITGNSDPDDIADAVSKRIAEQISRRKTTWQ